MTLEEKINQLIIKVNGLKTTLNTYLSNHGASGDKTSLTAAVNELSNTGFKRGRFIGELHYNTWTYDFIRMTANVPTYNKPVIENGTQKKLIKKDGAGDGTYTTDREVGDMVAAELIEIPGYGKCLALNLTTNLNDEDQSGGFDRMYGSNTDSNCRILLGQPTFYATTNLTYNGSIISNYNSSAGEGVNGDNLKNPNATDKRYDTLITGLEVGNDGDYGVGTIYVWTRFQNRNSTKYEENIAIPIYIAK